MRKLNPYERNQLQKYNIAEEKLLESEMPVEYLTGHVEFCALDFRVTSDVLIPRVETEEFVQLAVNKAQEIYKETNTELNIVDVGTGSGAIAIAVATKLKELSIPYKLTAVDISSDALEVAKANFERIDNSLSISFIQSDLMDNIDEDNIDLVLANLPYIPSERMSKLDSSVKDFEPHLALDGGDDGLALVRTLLKQAKDKLSSTGTVLLELDLTHDIQASQQFSNQWTTKVIKDFNEGIYFWSLNLI